VTRQPDFFFDGDAKITDFCQNGTRICQFLKLSNGRMGRPSIFFPADSGLPKSSQKLFSSNILKVFILKGGLKIKSRK
jgi:hypothetical protein